MISLLHKLRRSTRSPVEEVYAPVHPALIVALAPASVSVETLAADNASVKSFSSVEGADASDEVEEEDEWEVEMVKAEDRSCYCGESASSSLRPCR